MYYVHVITKMTYDIICNNMYYINMIHVHDLLLMLIIPFIGLPHDIQLRLPTAGAYINKLPSTNNPSITLSLLEQTPVTTLYTCTCILL